MLSAGEAQQRAAMLPNLSECRASAPTSGAVADAIRSGKDPVEVLGILEDIMDAKIAKLTLAVAETQALSNQTLAMVTNLTTTIFNLEMRLAAAAPPRQA